MTQFRHLINHGQVIPPIFEIVVLHKEVTSIGHSAFSKCVNLREVNLLDSSIEVIDEFAFKNCESLRPTIVKLSEFCLDTTMLEHP